MPIVAMEVPPRNLGGRARRMSDEDIKTLAERLGRGETVGDGENVGRKGTAHQRAKSALKAVREINKEIVATSEVWKTQIPSEDGESQIVWHWALVPPLSGRAR